MRILTSTARGPLPAVIVYVADGPDHLVDWAGKVEGGNSAADAAKRVSGKLGVVFGPGSGVHPGEGPHGRRAGLHRGGA